MRQKVQTLHFEKSKMHILIFKVTTKRNAKISFLIHIFPMEIEEGELHADTDQKLKLSA